MDRDHGTDTTTTPPGDAATGPAGPGDDGARTVVEEFEISGAKLVARVKELFEDASAKRVVIRSADGDELLTVPLTIGVAAGGVVTLAAPLLAALGALAALVSRVRLEVVREADADSAASPDGDTGSPS